MSGIFLLLHRRLLIIVSTFCKGADLRALTYNTPDGGPADSDVTSWIEARANQYLRDGCAAVQRVALSDALAQVAQYDYVARYIAEPHSYGLLKPSGHGEFTEGS